MHRRLAEAGLELWRAGEAEIYFVRNLVRHCVRGGMMDAAQGLLGSIDWLWACVKHGKYEELVEDAEEAGESELAAILRTVRHFVRAVPTRESLVYQLSLYARNDSGSQLVAGLAEQLGGEELVAGIKEGLVPELESTLVGHADAVKGICLLPESGNVVSVTVDLSLNVWDPRAGEILKRMKGPVGDIALARLSATTMAVGDSYGNVSVWDLETGAKACQFPRQKEESPRSPAFHPHPLCLGR